MRLSEKDRAMCDGRYGQAAAMAMRILVALGKAVRATGLIDISAAHIDGVLYIGRASLEYATRLRDLGGRVSVRTTLNVSSLDLLHPELFRGDPATAQAARATMQAYEDMGCVPTWTCAPYQLLERPAFGDRVAWAESNAVVFANSVLGARSERLGDFSDIAAAITGRIPEYGVYLDEHRRATVVYDVSKLAPRVRAGEQFFAVLGLLIGRDAGREIPAIVGIDAASDDELKVLGASAATSGTVPLVHVVGVTPEAARLEDIAYGSVRNVDVSAAALLDAMDSLSTGDGTLAAVNLGTPHYSASQIARLTKLLGGRTIHDSVAFYVNTGRDMLDAVPNVGELESLGVRFVTDTCTYLTPILEPVNGVAMTDSAKWAYYAPGNIGADVVFGTTEDCVESAVGGVVRRDQALWR